jgi:hypothetical protein
MSEIIKLHNIKLQLVKAVQEAADNDMERIDLYAKLILEFKESHKAIRDKGYGWTGLGLLKTIIQEVPDAES